MKYFLQIFILLLLQKLVYAQTSNNQLQEYNRLNKLISQNMETHPDSVIKWTMSQIDLAQQLKNDSLFINAQTLQSEALFNIGIYDECLTLRYNILSKLEKQKTDRRISELLLQTGWVYFELNDYAKYIEFAEKAKVSFIKTKHLVDTIRCNTEIGLGNVMLGNTKFGLDLLIQSKELGRKYIVDTFHKMVIFDNVSLAYTEMGDHENALLCQLDVEKNRHRVPPIYYEVASYEHLAEKYLAVKNFEKAIFYSDKALKYGVLYNNKSWLGTIYQNRADILKAQSKYKQANEYLQMSLLMRDSVQQEDYNIKMSYAANKYESEKKQNMINSLAKDKKIDAIAIQRLTLSLITLALLALLSAIYFLYKKNKKEKLLKEQFAQQLLHTQEEERQRIAKDLHDSVGQNILFIKNQLQNPNHNKESLVSSIDTALDEVRNISKDLYPNQLEKYGLASAVEALSQQINESTGIFVSSDMQGIDDALNKNVQINFYRIIQEFVNNTLKHAQATSIRITTEQTANEIILTVQDNGKGFDKESLQKKAHKSFGMLNMEERIKMLKGKVNIESEIGKGTKSTFTIPIK